MPPIGKHAARSGDSLARRRFVIPLGQDKVLGLFDQEHGLGFGVGGGVGGILIPLRQELIL
ncbi:hypothetical protein AYO44_09965 [Planctomycetaceae bacterium SCGC AG-212-F19]|nr:hypothetical protein AYO44_09965 [Planctomycetaceae bacterium SCGC AG-212-F19]